MANSKLKNDDHQATECPWPGNPYVGGEHVEGRTNVEIRVLTMY